MPGGLRHNPAMLIKGLRNVGPKARWVRPQNLHVTLKFTGEAPPGKLDGMGSAVGGVRAERAVEMDFRGLGFFPNEKHPRVLWANVEASSYLKSLAADIDHALEALGVPREQRPFTPHLTLARFPSPRIPEKLRDAIQQNIAREFGSLRTSEFHLIESKLKPSGAEYTRLASFSFAESKT